MATTPSMSSISTDLPPTSQRYKHIPLDKTKKEIRLVQIQPDSDDKTLRLVLKTAILTQKNDAESGSQVDSDPQVESSPYVESSSQVGTSSHVDSEEQDSRNSAKPVAVSEPIAGEGDDARNEFIALSYAWGDETPLYDVVIVDSNNIGWISIRQNLFDFLTTRRDSAAPSPWFWADQLCINQEDDQERGHQVNQMSQLYSTASKVEVWLGPGFEGSDEAFDYMNQNIEVPLSEWSESQMQAHSSAFRSIENLPYWSRLWIVQEIILGRDVTIRLGNKIAPWPIAFDYLHEKDISAPIIWLHLKSEETPSTIRHWGSVVWLTEQRACAVVKDRAFAMMGLVPEHTRFYPDYSMHVQEILLTILKLQTAYLVLQSSEQCNLITFPLLSEEHDIETCAQRWHSILSGSNHEIDLKAVRHFLLKEAHPLLRKSQYRIYFTELDLFVRRNRFQLLFTLGVGPTLLVRLNLRWLYPDRHSMFSKYRNRKRGKWISRP